MIINLVAEGYMEEVVAARLIPFCGHELGYVYGQRGCDYIRQRAAKFRYLATGSSGVLVLSDFKDTGACCIPEALKEYVFNNCPKPPATFLCRFAVNELESWLLADREILAKFLCVASSRIPHHPENETSPKKILVDLARTSKKRIIREGIAPPSGHFANEGPEYVSLMSEFVTKFWSVETAMCNAPSLARCARRLRELK